MAHGWVNILPDSWCNGLSLNKIIFWEKLFQYPRFKYFFDEVFTNYQMPYAKFMPEKMILNLFFPIISKYLSFYSSIPKNEEEKSTMTCGHSKKISKYMAKDYFILMIQFGAHSPPVLTV